MTQKRFIAECTTRTINPSVALENERVRQYLLTRQDALLLSVLDEEF